MVLQNELSLILQHCFFTLLNRYGNIWKVFLLVTRLPGKRAETRSEPCL